MPWTHKLPDLKNDPLYLAPKVDELTSELADNAISPDDFEGTDFEKVQQAINQVITTKQGIRFSRFYDVTNATPLMVDKSNRDAVRFIGVGGGLKKLNAGFMFSTNGVYVGDLNFQNIEFRSGNSLGTVLFDADKVIRVECVNCTFMEVDTIVKATTYMQTYHFIGGKAVGGAGWKIETPCAYDLSFTSFWCENIRNFFRQTEKTTYAGEELNHVRFRDCMFEAFSGEVFRFRSTRMLVLDGLYFEVNALGHITFEDGSVIEGVEIKNSKVYETSGTSLTSFIKWGASDIVSAKTSNNKVENIAVHDVSNAYGKNIISERENSNIKNIDPNGFIKKVEDLIPLDLKGKTFENQVINSSFEQKNVNVTTLDSTIPTWYDAGGYHGGRYISVVPTSLTTRAGITMPLKIRPTENGWASFTITTKATHKNPFIVAFRGTDDGNIQRVPVYPTKINEWEELCVFMKVGSAFNSSASVEILIQNSTKLADGTETEFITRDYDAVALYYCDKFYNEKAFLREVGYSIIKVGSGYNKLDPNNDGVADVPTGSSTSRPYLVNGFIGFMYFDTTLNKPIWNKGGNVWVDANGTVV